MICKKTEACFFELLKSPDVVRCKQKPLCLDFCDTRSEAVCKEKGKVYRLLNNTYNGMLRSSLSNIVRE